jgi:CheY-like chemotaxis protein
MAKILVFDKDMAARGPMTAALASLGHQAVFAADGYSVLPMVAEHKPVLIILDYNPPHVDGYEILLRLRAAAAFASIPIVFSSSTPKFEIEMVVLDAPAVGYIDKPLDTKQLKEVLSGLIVPTKPEPKAAPLAPPPTGAFSGEADLDGVRDDIIELD